MATTIRATQAGLTYVDQIRRRKGWKKTEEAWYGLAYTSESTLKRFWAGQPIQQDTFINICEAIGIENWQKLIDTNPIQTKTSYINFSVYDEDWVGREHIIDELSQEIHGSHRVLLLVGLTGIGKTALAEKLVEKLRGVWIEDRENLALLHKALLPAREPC